MEIGALLKERRRMRFRENKKGKNRSTVKVNNSSIISHLPEGTFEGRCENRGRGKQMGDKCCHNNSILSVEVERCITALSTLRWC